MSAHRHGFLCLIISLDDPPGFVNRQCSQAIPFETVTCLPERTLCRITPRATHIRSNNGRHKPGKTKRCSPHHATSLLSSVHAPTASVDPAETRFNPIPKGRCHLSQQGQSHPTRTQRPAFSSRHHISALQISKVHRQGYIHQSCIVLFQVFHEASSASHEDIPQYLERPTNRLLARGHSKRSRAIADHPQLPIQRRASAAPATSDELRTAPR